MSLKFVLLGESNCGKTSISRRISYADFAPGYRQTVGFDLFKTHLTLTSTSSVNVEIWDVGQLLHSPLMRHVLFETDVVILVYDITRQTSFEAIKEWIRAVKSISEPKFVLVGNKCDLAHLRQVKPDDHHQLCIDLKAKGFYVSARTKENIFAPFMLSAAECVGVDSKRLDFSDTGVIMKVVVDKTEEECVIVEEQTKKRCSVQ